MSTLIERLHEVMEAMQWEHADVVRVSKQSSSVVSQWLGKSSKIIKTIGKIEAAENLSVASGFSALWIAKGIGHKTSLTRGATLESDWPLMAVPANRYDALSPGERLMVEGAMLEAIERIEQSKRKPRTTAKETLPRRAA